MLVVPLSDTPDKVWEGILPSPFLFGLPSRDNEPAALGGLFPGAFFVELLNNHLRVAVVLLPGASRVSIIASATDVKVKLPRCDNVTL